MAKARGLNDRVVPGQDGQEERSGQAVGSRKRGEPRKGLEAHELWEAQGWVGKGQTHVFTEFSFSRLCFRTKGDVTFKEEESISS